MKFNDTLIQTAGVFRCCMESIVQQGDNLAEVKDGDKMTCQFCKREFELQPTEKNKPVWRPVTP